MDYIVKRGVILETMALICVEGASHALTSAAAHPAPSSQSAGLGLSIGNVTQAPQHYLKRREAYENAVMNLFQRIYPLPADCEVRARVVMCGGGGGGGVACGAGGTEGGSSPDWRHPTGAGTFPPQPPPPGISTTASRRWPGPGNPPPPLVVHVRWGAGGRMAARNAAKSTTVPEVLWRRVPAPLGEAARLVVVEVVDGT